MTKEELAEKLWYGYNKNKNGLSLSSSLGGWDRWAYNFYGAMGTNWEANALYFTPHDDEGV